MENEWQTSDMMQLLGIVEKRLDTIAATLESRNDVSTFKKIDETVLKISLVLRKARSIRNYFAPINQIPPETLALAVTFLIKQRDVLNATAVCQQWRAALLSFPRVWRRVGGTSSTELETYLERSKSIPIIVNLSSPRLAVSIVPHTFRLVTLTVWVDAWVDFEQVARALCEPIPTLRSLALLTKNRQLYTLQFPPGLSEGLFLHLKTLNLFGISSFVAPQTFPQITELTLCTGFSTYKPVTMLLNTLGYLPGLVKIYMMFQTNWYTEIDAANTVTLPCLREICLSASEVTTPVGSGVIPPILRFLQLPKATSVAIQSPFGPVPTIPVLPDTSFGDHLPNYVELPELRIETKHGLGGKVTFQSPSPAVLIYHTRALSDYKREVRLWGDLPLLSVRKATAVLMDPVYGDEDAWVVGLLGDLKSLETLELGGDCGHVLRRLRHRILRGKTSVSIKTLTVRGGEYAKSQTLKLEKVKSELGLENTTITFIHTPETHEGLADSDTSSGGEYSDVSGNNSSDEDNDGGGGGGN